MKIGPDTKLDHPIYKAKRTFGQKAADKITRWAGSWTFIIGFFIIVILWIYINAVLLLNYGNTAFDPYPFILLNLALSLLAALQAPVILMSQNRQSEIDRIRAEYDYSVNRRAEREIRELKDLILEMQRKKPKNNS
jgi:uncharacterized membrane protein